MDDHTRKTLAAHLIGELYDAAGSSEHPAFDKYREEARKQLLGAFDYLEKKYPDTDIEFRLFEPLTRVRDTGVLFCCLKDVETPHKVVITKHRTRYEYRDTLYSELVKETYDRALQEEMSRYDEHVRTDTSFFTPEGEAVSGRCSVEELVSYRPVITRHTDIFASEDFQISEQLLSLLRKGQYFGSYSVYRTKETGRPLSYIRELYDSESFNCFENEGEHV